ncbi:MAG: protein-(glutamine-N5) methyltransferase, release factor-specific [Acidobacteria bacterium RIFCSPLOWO2_02_FULL_68_18]|nr:MAG: protein-(glutamine-N5) methyltransferase, release factor-specific [Acidobacteria bacterium RIFCSPLOWO2_02_FULL_68_18]OFW51906.1 MAG: protein-(glutamine-N5) methyltransferase, release factor-specific [Acidobacteria bacterium RIFCSPLOWO2_12_FULL_68_19]
MTLHQRLAEARARLAASGIRPDEAALDVDLYARTILGWDRARLLAAQREVEPPQLEPRFSDWISRRERREPTAYITGVREFWGLEFAVTPAVLIPRPETEFVVEEALALARATPTPLVADIGTGSGCVAVAIAHECGACRVVATDISRDAIAVARANAVRHGVADRIAFVVTSYLDGVAGRFDVIAANPPYVRDGDEPALAAAVRYEPGVALFGGAEGFRDIAGVLDASLGVLAEGGWLVMEFGYGQQEHLEALVAARPGLAMVRVREDLQGIPRTAIIRRGLRRVRALG